MERRQIDVCVISDLHLGTYGCRANDILSYLKSISPQLLVLNGDIIDLWQLSKRYFPANHMQVIKEIISMMTHGTRVIYITGNHDEVLRRYAELNAGNFQLVDKLVMEIDNKVTWIFHGDVFDNTTKGAAKFWAKLGSNGYAILLALNRGINYLLQIFGYEKISLSKKIMQQVNKAIIRINDFESIASELAIEKKYKYVICGHIHQPQKRQYSNKNGSVTYLNSGDWVEHMSCLEYYNNDWHLYHHDESQTTRVIIKEEHSTPDVVSDEISFILYSLNQHS